MVENAWNNVDGKKSEKNYEIMKFRKKERKIKKYRQKKGRNSTLENKAEIIKVTWKKMKRKKGRKNERQKMERWWNCKFQTQKQKERIALLKSRKRNNKKWVSVGESKSKKEIIKNDRKKEKEKKRTKEKICETKKFRLIEAKKNDTQKEVKTMKERKKEMKKEDWK